MWQQYSRRGFFKNYLSEIQYASSITDKRKLRITRSNQAIDMELALYNLSA